MRPILALFALIGVAIGVAALTSSYHQTNRPLYETEKSLEEQGPKPPPMKENPDALKEFDKVKEGAIRATLEIEGKGTMTLELYPKAAPETVKHFTELAKRGFFEGILFHRVEPNFVAQAGDPGSKKVKPEDLRGLSSDEAAEKFHLGGGGTGASVPLEAKLPHIKDSIGLARSQAEDSGDSQFYINLNNNSPLDGQYCVFGKIVEGAEVAPKIAIGDRIKRLSVP